MKKKLGLIVNPVAGLGGRVGLKGSDGIEIQQRARELGAKPEAGERAVEALARLLPLRERLQILTWAGEMGESPARQAGFDPVILGTPQDKETTAEDTRRAANEILRQNIDLLLFAGGDGTARDIYSTIESSLPVLGIPAGVKIHSGAFAVNPARGGDLAASFLNGKTTRLHPAEVMDLDEEAFRQDRVVARLFGYLNIPYEERFLQGAKAGSAISEAGAAAEIARAVIDTVLQEGTYYIVGPGTTTRAIFEGLGLQKTLLGVDLLLDRQAVGADLNEEELLRQIADRPARIIVSPVGGQGYLFGRGNQQISPQVIRKVGGRENILVVSTVHKINALAGRSLRVDTGDAEVDAMLSGYVRVLSGYNEFITYPIA